MKKLGITLIALALLMVALISTASARPQELTGSNFECQIGSCKVMVSEIAWAGTLHSSTHEWFELYGNHTSPVNITGWKLKITGTPPGGGQDVTLAIIDIPYSGYIWPNQVLLFERGSDNTIKGRGADGIWQTPQFPNSPSCPHCQDEYSINWMILLNAQGYVVQGWHNPGVWSEGSWSSKQTMDLSCLTVGAQPRPGETWRGYNGTSSGEVWWTPTQEAWDPQYKDYSGNVIRGTPGYIWNAPYCP